MVNEGEEKDDEHLDNLQSGAWCFPTLSLLAKYNNDTYEKYFRPIYQYCEELRTFGVPKNGWKPFLVSEPQNMKSNWLCLKRGGPAKAPGVKHFCQLCYIRSNTNYLLNQVPCITCLDNGPDCDGRDLKGFHHPVMDANTIIKAKDDFEEVGDMPNLIMCLQCMSKSQPWM
jgi:hypothetical protein